MHTETQARRLTGTTQRRADRQKRETSRERAKNHGTVLRRHYKWLYCVGGAGLADVSSREDSHSR